MLRTLAIGGELERYSIKQSKRRVLMSDPMPGITVHVSSETAKDLKAMQKITANLLTKLGCPGCHSGHFISFREIREFVVNPATLDVHEFAGGPVQIR
jgi:hypothetical protein